MKYLKYTIPAILIGLLFPTIIWAVSTFSSQQLAPNPSNGNCLTTNGANPGVNAWSASCGSGGGSSAGSPFSTSSPGTIYNNFGYQLGINSSTPIANLSVVGSSTAPTIPILTVASSSNASYLTVLANGNVGINTSNPSARLDVNGTVRATGLSNPTSGAGIEFSWDGTNSNMISYDRSGSAYKPFLMGGSTVALQIGASTYLSIIANGNVGINTSTPQTALHVYSSAANIPIIADSNQAQTFINYRINNVSKSYAGYGGGGFEVINGNGATVNMIVLDTGNVGIGTSSPINRLSVRTAGATTAMTVQSAAGLTAGAVGIGSLNSAGRIQAFANDDTVNSGLANLLLNDSGGNVGIGTTSPLTKLHLEGDAANFTLNHQSASSYNQIVFAQGGVSEAFLSYLGSAFGGARQNTEELYTANGIDITFATAGAEAMRIKSGGNVGIGTITPYSNLVVEGVSGNQNIFSVASSSNAVYLTVSSVGSTTATTLSANNLTSGNCVQAATGGLLTTTGSACGSGGSGNSAWTIGNATIYNATSTDAVGIGTTTPTSAKFVVQESGSTGNVGDFVGSGTSAYFNLSPIGADKWFLGAGNLVTNDLGFYNVTRAYTGIEILGGAGGGNAGTGGQVGIGSTSPLSAMLAVQGNKGGADILRVSSSSLATVLNVTASSRVGINSSTPNASLVVQGRTQEPTLDILRVASSTGVNVFSLTNTGNATFQPNATSTAAFVLNNPSGNAVINVDESLIDNSPSTNILNVASSTGTSLFTVNGFGQAGINSSTPTTFLSVQGLSGSTFDIFDASTSTGLSLFHVSSSGVGSSSTPPTLSSCGTSPTFSAGSDNFGGEVVPGATAGGCTITWGIPFIKTPVCTVSNQSMSVVNAMTYTISTSALTLTMTGIAGDKVDYICKANPN